MAVVEYFYSAHSAYAYIGSARLAAVAAAGGRRLEHRPIDLRRVVAATGPGPTNALTPQRRAYFSGRALRRWAEFRGAPLRDGWPSHHDNDPGLANRMLVAAAAHGARVDALAHAMLEAHWRDDADLADRDTLRRIGAGAGLDADRLLDDADGDAARAAYEANSAEAVRRSVFGSPTYFVDGDMFYGQDQLELVARALERPFAGRWPPDDG